MQLLNQVRFIFLVLLAKETQWWNNIKYKRTRKTIWSKGKVMDKNLFLCLIRIVYLYLLVCQSGSIPWDWIVPVAKSGVTIWICSDERWPHWDLSIYFSSWLGGSCLLILISLKRGCKSRIRWLPPYFIIIPQIEWCYELVFLLGQQTSLIHMCDAWARVPLCSWSLVLDKEELCCPLTALIIPT